MPAILKLTANARLLSCNSPMKYCLLGGLLLSMLVGLVGCQQTQIEFTPIAEPSLPEFKPLQGAPSIPQLVQPAAEQLLLAHASAVQLSANLTLYPVEDRTSTLNHMVLVAYSQQPMTNIDVLVQAFRDKALLLAQQSTLACSENLRVSASMHSVSLSIDCPDSAVLASELLMQFWRPDSFSQLDIANVRRQLKLGKHINAYSGAEIDELWAKIILGEQHIYNQALNDESLADTLDLTKLNQIKQQIINQSQWALLTNQSLSQDKQFIASWRQGASAFTEQGAQPATMPTSTTAKSMVSASNTEKTIVIIDAPGSVQTQVRIGYPLDASLQNDPSQDCQILASWLGRSFSGRLYYDLREVRGLTYGIYGRCFDNPLSRTLKFYGSTKLEHTGAFITGVLDHLELAAESSASDAELSALKTYLNSQKILRQASHYAIKADTIKQLIRGKNIKQLQAQNQRLDALTPAQLQTIAQRVFLNTPYIVIRGDKAKITVDLAQKLPSWKLVSATDRN